MEHLIDWMMPESRRANVATFCRSNMLDIGRSTGYHNPRTQGHAYCNQLNDKIERLNRITNVNDIARIIQFDRYHKLNMNAFGRYGTVEVRHHSGTINAEKICKWVRVCQSILRESDRSTNVRKLQRVEVSFDQFCRTFYRLDDRIAAQWAMQRAHGFMSQAGMPVRNRIGYRNHVAPRVLNADPDAVPAVLTPEPDPEPEPPTPRPRRRNRNLDQATVTPRDQIGTGRTTGALQNAWRNADHSISAELMGMITGVDLARPETAQANARAAERVQAAQDEMVEAAQEVGPHRPFVQYAV